MPKCIQKNVFKTQKIKDNLQFQQQYYKRYYDWKIIGNFWNRFLKGALHDKRRQQKDIPDANT